MLVTQNACALQAILDMVQAIVFRCIVVVTLLTLYPAVVACLCVACVTGILAVLFAVTVITNIFVFQKFLGGVFDVVLLARCHNLIVCVCLKGHNCIY